MSSVPRDRQHTKQNRCPICAGAEQDPRGQGKRCRGFTSDDGEWVRCSREELGGRLSADGSGLFVHKMHGHCDCGTAHNPSRTPDIEATYDYRDESGQLVYQVVRKTGKRFLQRVPLGGDEWEWKLGDTRRLLYRLPELIASADRIFDPVYVVEGEKDVDTLTRHGFIATCNSGGAGKWPAVAELAALVLKGRMVVVVADRDEPGRKHAHAVTATLIVQGIKARCLEPPDPHKDASDLVGALGPSAWPGSLVELPPASPVLHVVPEVPAWLDDEHPGPTTPPDDDRRPEVRLRGDSARNVDALDEALSDAAPDVFQRALQLVEIVEERKPSLVASGAPVLRALNKHSLETHVARFLRCVRWQPAAPRAVMIAEKAGREAMGSWVQTRASSETAILPMLAYGRWQKIRPITGITESPLFRPDGTIMQDAGYDAPTGYIFRPNTTYSAVPEAPTQDDARLALKSLQHVFCDFPYVSEAASAVPIAALLTILARAAIDGNVPVFAFEASIQGSGKTMQGDVVHIIATGRLPPHSSFPHDENEQRSSILSCALSGSPVAFFDNVKGIFGGEALEGVVTSGEIKQRILGASVDVVVRWIATILVTGNNMTMTEDMLRRSLLCRIEPDVEDPTKRTKFEHDDLPAWTKSERGRLIVAALTMLRAYAAKGYPDAGTGVMQSFQAWSRIVPGCIAFAGGPNVLEAIGVSERTVGDDAAGYSVVVRELPRLSLEPLTAKAILDAVYPAPRKDEAPDGWDDFRAALESLAPGRGGFPPTAKALGMALRSRVGQVSAGARLRSKPTRDKVQTWYVETLAKGPRTPPT